MVLLRFSLFPPLLPLALPPLVPALLPLVPLALTIQVATRLKPRIKLALNVWTLFTAALV